ncbi:hypothetical protein F4781DRAFT_165158 [Annulohypoxylon bovei var. microspora]|nr:hypothetical protein F4781DRAFT_165158 [Annulohypoxylon bovei var. microspora]
MPSNTVQSSAPAENNGHSTFEQSYMLRKYLRSDATVSERSAGLASLDKKSHLDKAKDRIKDFDDAWAKSSKEGN